MAFRPSSAQPRDSAPETPAARLPAFCGAIDGVLVGETPLFDTDGAVPRAPAEAVWLWMRRDLAPDLIDPSAPDPAEAFEASLPEVLRRARAAIGGAQASEDALRRLRGALGGEEHRLLLARVLNALRCRAVIGKAQSFGRAANAIAEDAALAAALQSMPLQDPGIAALLMQAAMGEVAAPARLVAAAMRLSGAPDEPALARAGFGPLVEAIHAHAQDQLADMEAGGAFADIDRVCGAIERFHRLHRALGSQLELAHGGRWAQRAAELTRAASDRIEPFLHAAGPAINRALRPGREPGPDSHDILTALNGTYVLAAVRDCRASLALNALFDRVWALAGQAIELHTGRHLEKLRARPGDEAAALRLDAGIKMAELRFGPDYAGILRRARDAAERRHPASGP